MTRPEASSFPSSNPQNTFNAAEDQQVTRLPTEDPSENETEMQEVHKLPLATRAPPPPPPPRDVQISPIVFAIMAIVVLVFTVVSVGIPWYRVRQYNAAAVNGSTYENTFYLFKTVYKVNGVHTRTTHPADYCSPVKHRVKAIEAFAVVSSVLAFAMTVLSTLYLCWFPTAAMRIVMLVVTACTVGSLTVQVSMNFNVYVWSFHACGPHSSYHSQLYEPAVGFGLTVTAWVLTVLGGIIAANDLTVPMDARSVRIGVHAFTVLSLVAGLFAVVSSPIPHWFYKDGNINKATDVLLWRQRLNRFDWNTTLPNNPISTAVQDLGCPALTRYFRAAEAFNVISIFLSFCAGASGFLLWKDLAGTRIPSVAFSHAAWIATLVQLALELHIYYSSWCDGLYAYSKKYYVLSSGFGLMATTFCLHCVAAVMITVIQVCVYRYFPALKPTKSAKAVFIDECR